MAKWEYKSLEFFIEKVGRGYFDTTRLNLTKFDQEINQMGEEGWELVNTMTTSDHQGTTGQIVSVFKRLKS
ncbi:DUF4177 domain-containing protein [Cohnella sp.]|uniref:DUF4177 domain-containing protein n=1 Tax=Cohnella sp. TaxID=1883426 RepID=UPI0037041E1A